MPENKYLIQEYIDNYEKSTTLFKNMRNIFEPINDGDIWLFNQLIASFHDSSIDGDIRASFLEILSFIKTEELWLEIRKCFESALDSNDEVLVEMAIYCMSERPTTACNELWEKIRLIAAGSDKNRSRFIIDVAKRYLAENDYETDR